MAGVKRRVFTGPDIRALHKELDEVSCPICMDHPHNAILLLCSSHDKGCRSYICDTSYRHSNCLDRFKKLKENPGDRSRLPSSSDTNSVIDVEDSSESKANLKCPMCRGAIMGWEVVDEAREYLNMKKRSCSGESCSFSGSYQELRRHARRVHPTTRPSDIDPSRERAWQRLENQTEYGDIVSVIRSAIPGAVVVGDYVIETGDRLSIEADSGSLWRYYLFEMVSSSIDGQRRPPRSRGWTRHRRSAVGSLPERRFLWGENLLGLQDERVDEDDLHILSDIGEDEPPVPRRRRRDEYDDLRIVSDIGEDEPPVPTRRRLTRSRSDENHP